MFLVKRTGILSKCLILTFGNIIIENHDSLISKKNKMQNITFKLSDKMGKLHSPTS